MHARVVAPLLLLGLGTLVGLSHAAPGASPAPKAKTTCAVPTAEQCKSDPALKDVSYCSTTPATPSGMDRCSAAETAVARDPCTLAMRAACKDIVLETLKHDPGRDAAPKHKVLAVAGDNLPKDLKDGHKRSKYSKPAKGRALAVAGKNVIARSGLTRAPGFMQPSALAAKAHRQPKWDANGEAIHSCEEFAYEELYDGMRYIDAVGACAGDRACEVEIAYMTATPGIARRTLKRKDGKPMKHQLNVRDSGTMLKNDMFLARRQFAYSLDPVDGVTLDFKGKRHFEKTPEMDAIAGLLDDGKKWYEFGCTKDCGPRKFKNEWGFHDKLRDRNKLSAAEFAEYERRKAEFRSLYEEWTIAAKEALARKKANEKALNDRINKPRQAQVSRLDRVTSDPSERIDRMTADVAQIDAGRSGAGSPAANLPNAGEVAGGVGYRGKADPGVGVLGSPAAKPATPKVRKAKGITLPHCHPSHWADRDANMDDLYYAGPASCAIADFLKEEYRRKAAGQKSCLDLGEDDCDWSPETFHGRFVASFPLGNHLQDYESYCKHWTNGKIDADNLDTPEKPKSTLVGAEQYISKMKKLVGVALEKIAPYRLDSVQVDGQKRLDVGGRWQDSEGFGDKDWFAAGYDYDVGWDIHPVKLAKKKDICALTGSAHGAFGIDATILGGDINIVDADSHFNTNKGNKGESHFDANLSILGHAMFDEINQNFDTAWAPEDPIGGSFDLPEGAHPSITIMAGPVPVTGSAWGSIFYGANLSAVAKQPKGCDPDNIAFSIKGVVEPDMGVAGYLEVGAGISGLLSAGIRGSLTLVSLGLPFRTELKVTNMKIDAKNRQPTASFDASLDLAVSTLSGYIALYIEIFFFSDEWELFSWSGVSDEVALMDPALRADLPLLGWPE